MAETMMVRAKLDAGMRFEVEAGSGHRVTLDAAEQSGGQNAGFRPMELLLVGLAGCTGMDVISILRKKRQDVTGYEVQVQGVRAETHPMVFEDITVEHIITGHHIDREAVRRAIELSESRYCGAGAMLGCYALLVKTWASRKMRKRQHAPDTHRTAKNSSCFLPHFSRGSSDEHFPCWSGAVMALAALACNKALRRARSSLSALAERAPRTAHAWQGDELIDIPAEAVAVGMEIVVKPGELIPVDGVVTAGSSSISEADLTGEPVPVRKTPGMPVLSGSVNLDSILSLRASKRSAESKYAQIVKLVEEAQAQKAPIHRLADRYSIGFTVAAVGLAGLAWALSGDSVYALAVMVVATPCPLILATPIAIMSGIDLAARHGIIVKSGAAIEQLGGVDIAVFDKTGTLTLGTPKVTAIVPGGESAQSMREEIEGNASVPALYFRSPCPYDASAYDEDTLLRLAASVEQLSTHILAHAIVEAAQERELPLSPAANFEEAFGKGVQGRVPISAEDRQVEWHSDNDFVTVAVGSRTFMQQFGISIPPALLSERKRRVDAGQICSCIAVNQRVEGLIVLEDVPRADLSRLSTDLRAAGMKETILLTGDSEAVARQIGDLAQVDRVISRCLPEDKVRIVKELVQQGHRVLMVGDGINDAPALATATVGMALGAQGLTAAAAAADTVLLSSDILRVVKAVRLGRWVMRVALQGIWVGMGLSALAMVFAAFGFIIPAAGAILQEGIDVIVILNALRAGRIRL